MLAASISGFDPQATSSVLVTLLSLSLAGQEHGRTIPLADMRSSHSDASITRLCVNRLRVLLRGTNPVIAAYSVSRSLP